jgi:hypothetical protein
MLQIRCRGQQSRWRGDDAPQLQHALLHSGLARRTQRFVFSSANGPGLPRGRGADQRTHTCRAAFSNGASHTDFDDIETSQASILQRIAALPTGFRRTLHGMDGLWGRFLPMVSECRTATSDIAQLITHAPWPGLVSRAVLRALIALVTLRRVSRRWLCSFSCPL